MPFQVLFLRHDTPSTKGVAIRGKDIMSLKNTLKESIADQSYISKFKQQETSSVLQTPDKLAALYVQGLTFHPCSELLHAQICAIFITFSFLDVGNTSNDLS